VSTELTITPASTGYSTVQTATSANSGGSDIYTKLLEGHASLAGGLEVDFKIYITKVGSSIGNDIADKSGDYTITVDKA
jgi:hypothetical protein